MLVLPELLGPKSPVIGANRMLPARELIERVMHESDEFVAGAAQYDDMTLITARVTAHEGGLGAS